MRWRMVLCLQVAFYGMAAPANAFSPKQRVRYGGALGLGIAAVAAVYQSLRIAGLKKKLFVRKTKGRNGRPLESLAAQRLLDYGQKSLKRAILKRSVAFGFVGCSFAAFALSFLMKSSNVEQLSASGADNEKDNSGHESLLLVPDFEMDGSSGALFPQEESTIDQHEQGTFVEGTGSAIPTERSSEDVKSGLVPVSGAADNGTASIKTDFLSSPSSVAAATEESSLSSPVAAKRLVSNTPGRPDASSRSVSVRDRAALSDPRMVVQDLEELSAAEEFIRTNSMEVQPLLAFDSALLTATDVPRDGHCAAHVMVKLIELNKRINGVTVEHVRLSLPAFLRRKVLEEVLPDVAEGLTIDDFYHSDTRNNAPFILQLIPEFAPKAWRPETTLKEAVDFCLYKYDQKIIGKGSDGFSFNKCVGRSHWLNSFDLSVFAAMQKCPVIEFSLNIKGQYQVRQLIWPGGDYDPARFKFREALLFLNEGDVHWQMLQLRAP